MFEQLTCGFEIAHRRRGECTEGQRGPEDRPCQSDMSGAKGRGNGHHRELAQRDGGERAKIVLGRHAREHLRWHVLSQGSVPGDGGDSRTRAGGQRGRCQPHSGQCEQRQGEQGGAHLSPTQRVLARFG